MKRSLCFLAVIYYLGFCLCLNQAIAQMPGAPVIDTPLTTSKTYFYNGEIIVPYSNGHVSVSNNAAVNIFSTTEVSLLPGFTASVDSGCTEFVAGIQPCPEIVLGKIVNNVTCNMGHDGEISVFPTGGISPYNFNWGINHYGTSIITSLEEGTYPLLVTDGSGCSVRDTFRIFEPTALEVTVHVTESDCHYSNGTAKLIPTGGNGMYTYLWQRNNEVVDSLSDLRSGVYTVFVKDSLGCSKVVTVSISDSDGPAATYSVTKNIRCNGQANGQVQILTPDLDYDPVPYWPCGGIPDRLGAGNYPVMVQDSNDCATIVDVEITEPLPIELEEIYTLPSCDSGNGSILVNASGGSGRIIYSWLTGDNDSLLNDVASGQYTVMVMDTDSCTLSKTFFLNNLDGPEISATITNATCSGEKDGSVLLSTTDSRAPITYSWTDDVGLNSTANNLGMGHYSVIVTNSDNCKLFYEFEITEPDPILIFARKTPVDSSNKGSLKAIVEGGIPPYNFYWSNGMLGEEIKDIDAGNYNLRVTDAIGCSATQDIDLELFNPMPSTCSDNTPFDYSNIQQTCSCTTIVQGTDYLDLHAHFGAIANDRISDEQSFEWANDYIQTHYGGTSNPVTLFIPRGTYLVGRQNPTIGRFLKGHNVLCFEGCSNLSIEGEMNPDGSPATIIQFDDCMKYGAFDPTPGSTYGYRYIHSSYCCLYGVDPNCVVVPDPTHPGTNLQDCSHNPDPDCGCYTAFGNVNDYNHMASIGICVTFTNCRSSTIKNLEINGNVDNYAVGGYFAADMAGINAESTGILIDGGSNNVVENCNVHHFGQDGIAIIQRATNNTSLNLSVRDSKFEWNCRNGASWDGGRGLTMINCDFNYNGFGPWGGTAPRSGMDAEYESANSIGSILGYGQFSNCRFIENRADGFVADKGGTSDEPFEHDLEFYNCTFVSGAFVDGNGNYISGQSVRPDSRSMLFKCCDFYGWINEIYNDRSVKAYNNKGPGTKFFQCTFNESYTEPNGITYSHSKNGGICGGYEPMNPLIDILERKRILWDGCTFNSNHFSKWIRTEFLVDATNTSSIARRYNRFNIIRNCQFYKYGPEVYGGNSDYNWLGLLDGANVINMQTFLPSRLTSCNCNQSYLVNCYYLLIRDYCYDQTRLNIIGYPAFPYTIPMLYQRVGGGSLCPPTPLSCANSGVLPLETAPLGDGNDLTLFPCYDQFPGINSPIIWNIYGPCDPPNCTITTAQSNCPQPPIPLRTYIASSSKNNDFKITPNPVTSMMTIQNVQAGDIISIYDLYSNCLMRYAATSEQNIIDLSKLPTGIYFIQLNFETVQKFAKL
ncbi:MAG: right-handed parallel beta-helix repeat-containing protein [Bacteroidetes bacterium]|nr:right-handed parallel beta-helix repeat-containing protein [Bacteroidota bacterium]MBL0137458.1 right-handed parallel beta-helix repeat-containing protein [Bacteroidota bacterium]